MKPKTLTQRQARDIWIRAQKLDTRTPFGDGSQAALAAIKQLGYVQIDTINVIERCHHHILFSRIPNYRRADLAHLQSVDKSVFEYWTHALAYIPTDDIRYFLPQMKAYAQSPSNWFSSVSKADTAKVMARVRESGTLSIRDIDDDELVEKDHAWASRKPSKRALQLAFYSGKLAVCARQGMLKSYALFDDHFGWETRPRPATENQYLDYILSRALRAQGIVSLDSVCYLDARRKPAIAALIEKRVRARKLVPVLLEGDAKPLYWATPQTLAPHEAPAPDLIHILSPFDPLIIQRKRLERFFGYTHLFEAYVPKAKRKLGYFALPVLAGDQIVAAIDIKTDRTAGTLAIQQWTWIDGADPALKPAIEAELSRFQAFQLDS
jgi:uncharacterized protein